MSLHLTMPFHIEVFFKNGVVFIRVGNGDRYKTVQRKLSSEVHLEL